MTSPDSQSFLIQQPMSFMLNSLLRLTVNNLFNDAESVVTSSLLWLRCCIKPILQWMNLVFSRVSACTHLNPTTKNSSCTIDVYERRKKWSLQWRHNGRDSVWNHQPHDHLLNRLFRRRSKKTSKLRVTGLCAGNSPGSGEFPAQMASYAENVSIWWRHHMEC